MAPRRFREQPFLVLSLFGLFLLACLLCGACSSSEEAESGCNVTAFTPDLEEGLRTDVMVPMRDCTRLATDVYLPEGDGPFPAILARLPYHKQYGIDDLPVMWLFGMVLSLNGHAVVIQDTRGRYASDGEFVPFKDEEADGIDTVRWIEAQPWFDGNLGMFGASYFGFTQLAVAHHRPACLKTIVPLVTPGTLYSMLYYSGLPRADMVVKWALDLYEDGSMDGDAFDEAALHWPLDEADDMSVGDVPWFDEWLAHPFDDDFYERILPRDVYERIDVPMLMLSGWFDIFADTQLADFETARAHESFPGATRIIVGPWTHNMGFMEMHDLTFCDARNILDFMGPIIDWFDYHLKGEPICMDWGPARLYDPGAHTWIDRAELWPATRRERVLYLAGDQGASDCTPTGELAGAPALRTSEISYTYDPLDAIVNLDGALLDVDNGCLVQESRCGRADVITFESAPFEEAVTIDGHIFVDLRVSSSAPDTAFIARLALIREDGNAYNLRQEVLTLTHRNGDQEPATYTPFEIIDIRIGMTPLLWTIHAGERLRLDLASSSYPAVVQHPNVSEGWFSVASPQAALQTIHLDPEHPSRLVLSIGEGERR